ncbi:OmpA family protein [Zavarzinia sp.]|uniref:OmpA family protein n=1 Tax=Zavarzinia sp. TaxID=2027920 RepID=UPI00356572B2
MRFITSKTAAALVGGILAAGAAPAWAEGSSGPYIGGYLGYSIPSSIDAAGDFNGNGTADSGKLDLDNGFGGGALFGYDYGAIRAEAQVDYRSFSNNGYKNATVDGASVGTYPADGQTGILATMGNVLYEYENSSPVTPYVGVGLGAGWVFADGGHDAGFAYQGIVGAKVGLGGPVAAFVDYRYLGVTNVKSANLDGSVTEQNLQAGLIYTFDSYTPPPPPAPQTEPATPADAAMARSFMVFFDWNSAAITEQAATIIQDAAHAAVSLGTSRIELTGHADRSGSPGYNKALSLRRAEAVKAQLIALGLNAAEIVTVGKGESAPLVPTPDGVREPQNRRVEIVLP